jgi:hypothetical protein
MSPFSTWLNSWPITPCSSARFSRSSAPCVTAIAASVGRYPAANALIAVSCSSTYTSGTGTPDAIAISSTTFSRRRRRGSCVSRVTFVPPSAIATAPPPPRSCDVRYSAAMPMTPKTSSAVASATSRLERHQTPAGATNGPSLASARNSTSTTHVIAATTVATASAYAASSQRVRRRDAAWAAKKSIGCGPERRGVGAAPARSAELHLGHRALLG